MKKLLYLLLVVLTIVSCTASKSVTTGKENAKKEKRLAQQNAIRQAIESHRYIIKANRLYLSYGGYADLVPKFNYIIVDGEIASVSLGYAGRSYGARRITGINFNGHTVKYEMVSNGNNGKYQINMKVAKGSDTFDFYITVSPSGNCTFSILNQFIGSINYHGEVVPVTSSTSVPPKKEQF